MRLTQHEKSLLAGEHGTARQRALEQQMEVGHFFDAEDFVEISQVHIMCDTESLGDSGIEWLEALAATPATERRVCVPTVTDPRGIDLCAYRRLGQPEAFAERERRASAALAALGILMTDTCINYQTVQPPVRGEHLAFGDTGSTIYANSVLGARSNFEGGPSALAAALTGRVPRYGCHLDSGRRGTLLLEVEEQPRTLSDWGALGALVGQRAGSYWTVPVITGIDSGPGSDALKHFGAAVASYGSVPLFHMPGITPEFDRVEDAFDGPLPAPTRLRRADLDAFYSSFGRHEDGVDVVVFAAPQLSLLELDEVASLLTGKRVHEGTGLLLATSPENASACRRLGLAERFEAAGATLLSGVCFYQMYARELGEARGWRKLVTNSAKLANIISGYGYEPVLARTEECVEAAVRGRM